LLFPELPLSSHLYFYGESGICYSGSTVFLDRHVRL
jgi:hypothetical protein